MREAKRAGPATAEWLDATVIRQNRIRFSSRIFHSIWEPSSWILSLPRVHWNEFLNAFSVRGHYFQEKNYVDIIHANEQKRSEMCFVLFCLWRTTSGSPHPETFLLRAKFIKLQILLEKLTVERAIYQRSLSTEHNLINDTNRGIEQQATPLRWCLRSAENCQTPFGRWTYVSINLSRSFTVNSTVRFLLLAIQMLPVFTGSLRYKRKILFQVTSSFPISNEIHFRSECMCLRIDNVSQCEIHFTKIHPRIVVLEFFEFRVAEDYIESELFNVTHSCQTMPETSLNIVAHLPHANVFDQRCQSKNALNASRHRTQNSKINETFLDLMVAPSAIANTRAHGHTIRWQPSDEIKSQTKHRRPTTAKSVHSVSSLCSLHRSFMAWRLIFALRFRFLFRSSVQ